MECRTNEGKKRSYQMKLWALALGNILLFAGGCIAMVTHVVPDALRGLMALALVVLVGCLFPSCLFLIQGLGISGTQRVFLTEDTLLYMTWDADNGVGGAKHRFYKVWKVSDYEVKGNNIRVNAFVWYAEKVMVRGTLPVTDGYLGDVSEIFEKAERCQREFTIKRTLDGEEQIIAMLEKRSQEAVQLEKGSM